MINSGAFPNVTFRNPPMPGPERAASSSVARPMSAAVGMTPSADAAKINTASAWTTSSTIATGISGTSRYGQPSPVKRKERFVVSSGVCVVNWCSSRLNLDHSRREDIPLLTEQSSRLSRTYCMPMAVSRSRSSPDVATCRRRCRGSTTSIRCPARAAIRPGRGGRKGLGRRCRRTLSWALHAVIAALSMYFTAGSRSSKPAARFGSDEVKLSSCHRVQTGLH